MLRSDENFTDENLALHVIMVVNARLYNGLWARNLMPCVCRDFYDFHKSMP